MYAEDQIVLSHLPDRLLHHISLQIILSIKKQDLSKMFISETVRGNESYSVESEKCLRQTRTPDIVGYTMRVL
jgi:hypothetical protein